MSSAPETLALCIALLHSATFPFLVGDNVTEDRVTERGSITSDHWTVTDEQSTPAFVSMTTASAKNMTYELICENMSCAGRCGEESEIFRRIPCSCDSRCELFRDCCVDYKSQCSEYRRENQSPSDMQRFDKCDETSCFRCVYHERFSFKPVYMVSTCPENYSSPVIDGRCADSTSDLVSRHIPVFLNGTDYLYRNVYCAICHSLDLSTLKVFPTEIFCPENETDSRAYLGEISLMQITFSEVRDSRCKFRILLPESEEFPERQCVRTDMETCESPGPLKDACEAFLQPIKVALNENTDAELVFVARNQYCAECSKYPDEVRFCWRKMVTSPDIPVPGFRFSLLFDFTRVLEETKRREAVAYELDESEDTENFRSCSIDVYLKFPTDEDARTVQKMVSSSLKTSDVSVDACDISSSNNSVKMEKTENVTLYHVKAYYVIILSVSKLIENLHRFFQLPVIHHRIVFASLRNMNASLKEVCVSDPRHYNNNVSFLELIKSKEENDYIDNNTSVLGTTNFPLEMVWTSRNNTDVLVSCSELIGMTEAPSSALNSRFSVCGDSAEPTCTLVTYDIQDVLNVTGKQNLSALNLTVLYKIGNLITACKEHMHKVTVRFPGEVTALASEVEMYVTIIGCFLSILGLFTTVFTYCTFGELRNLAGKCVLNLVVAMLLAQMFFVLSSAVAWRNDITCQVVAIVQHFLWLSTFSWTNIMAYDLARTFSSTAAVPRTRTGNKRYYAYCSIAWTVPFVIVLLSTVVNYFTDLSVGYGLNRVCWIRGRYSMVVTFIGPVSAHILFNLSSFVYTIYHIRKVGKLASEMNVTSEKRGRLGVYARITAIMGFTWILGYLGNLWPVHVVWVIFAAFNSLQGFFLFVSFVLTSKVISMYRQRFRPHLPTGSTKQRASTSTSTSNLLVTSSTAV